MQRPQLPEQHKWHPQHGYMFSTVPNHVVVLGRPSCPYCVKHLTALRQALPHINAHLTGGANVECGAAKTHFTFVNTAHVGGGVPSTAVFNKGKVMLARGSQKPDFYHKLQQENAKLAQQIAGNGNNGVTGLIDGMNKASTAANKMMDTLKRGKGFLAELESVGSKVATGVEAAAPELETAAEAAAMLAGGRVRRQVSSRRGAPQDDDDEEEDGYGHGTTGRDTTTTRSAHDSRARRQRVVNSLKLAIYNMGPGRREQWLPSDDIVVTEVLAAGTPSEEDADIMKQVHMYTLLNNVKTREHLAVYGEVLDSQRVVAEPLATMDVMNHVPQHSKGMVPSTQVASILQRELGYKVHEEALSR